MMRVSTSYAAIPDAKKFYVLSNLVKARHRRSDLPRATQETAAMTALSPTR